MLKKVDRINCMSKDSEVTINTIIFLKNWQKIKSTQSITPNIANRCHVSFLTRYQSKHYDPKINKYEDENYLGDEG